VNQKFPPIGSVVAVVWRDSGVGFYQDDIPNEGIETVEMITYGVLAHIGAEDIVVVSENEVGSAIDHSVRSGIWIPSIRSITVLRERSK